MGHFDNHWILTIADVFMLQGAISFALHYNNFTRRALRGYRQDEETRWMLISVAAISFILFLFVFNHGVHDSVSESISQALFHVISFMTSTGYGADDLSAWPAATAGLLIMASYMGGCAGSTAGGSKFIRNILTVRILRQQMMQAIHRLF